MNYIPVVLALSLAILYIVMGVPPSVFSKAACVALGLALLYFGHRARNQGSRGSFEEGPGASDREGPGAPG